MWIRMGKQMIEIYLWKGIKLVSKSYTIGHWALQGKTLHLMEIIVSLQGFTGCLLETIWIIKVIVSLLLGIISLEKQKNLWILDDYVINFHTAETSVRESTLKNKWFDYNLIIVKKASSFVRVSY